LIAIEILTKFKKESINVPIIKSAIKRVKQAEVARKRNVAAKRALKAAIKAFEAKPSASTLSAAHSELDKLQKKNLLPKNTVARRKSALSAKAKAAGVKLAAAKPKTAAKPAAKKAPAKAATAKKPAAKKAPAKKPATKK
jgi:ribosomal protein S20